jgi:regulator of protease activity HflC (stomatin/prohibitin superfamily)
MEKETKKFLKFVISIGVILVLLFVLNPISCIGATNRGIRYTFGAAGDEILEPGLQFHAPIVGKIKTWSIKPRTYDLTIDIEQRGAISSDNQIIGLEGKIVWNFDPTKINIIAKQYPSQDDLENIIKNTSYAALKTVIGKFTIFDLAKSQAAISDEAFENLKRMLLQYPITITQFNVTNFDWSGEFDERINQTMAAAQQVKEMEQQAAITEQRSRQAVIQAEADARALVAKAEGQKQAAQLNADAARIEAQGVADANRIRGAPTSLEYQRLLWDYEVKMERAKHLAPGVEVPQYIPLNPAGGIVTLPGR